MQKGDKVIFWEKSKPSIVSDTINSHRLSDSVEDVGEIIKVSSCGGMKVYDIEWIKTGIVNTLTEFEIEQIPEIMLLSSDVYKKNATEILVCSKNDVWKRIMDIKDKYVQTLS
jgi:hypothetical protein